MLNVFIHSTTAVPICSCSFDTYFHIAAGQNPELEKFSINILEQVGVYSGLF